MKPLSQKIQDTVVFVTDSIEAHPFIKGGIPALAAGGLGFIDHLEQWLRFGSVCFGFLIGGITLYLSIRKLIREHK